MAEIPIFIFRIISLTLDILRSWIFIDITINHSDVSIASSIHSINNF